MKQVYELEKKVTSSFGVFKNICCNGSYLLLLGKRK